MPRQRAYLPGTNVLRTELRTATGSVAVTDFMPVGREPGSRPNEYVRLAAPGWLVRLVEGLAGTVELAAACRLSDRFGAHEAMLEAEGGVVRALGLDRALHGDWPWRVNGGEARAQVTLCAGERRFLALAPSSDRVSAQAIDALLAATCAFWREWIGYCRYDGPYAAQVERSALVLKLMTYAPTGACVAALTTSLPEEIGGERNWDYRFCWIRDASLMLHALAALGYSGESHAFFGYLCELLANGVERLQVMYGIGHEPDLTERCVDLEGYRASRPVRVGNAAHGQNQTDLYGYLLEGALVYRLLGARFEPGDAEALAAVADFIEGCWERPDTGIWEMRGPPRHFVHSKAMCWIVLDRALKVLGHRPRWAALRERIWHEIDTRGRSPEGHLLQCFDGDGDEVDAALLQLATLGLPIDVDTIRRTRLAIERTLRRGDFIERYRTPDGVRGGEGAFLICSFWHVDALLAEGQRAAAGELYERLLAVANDVGLYSEEYDPASGRFLGNFPQAFTHLGLVNTAVSLSLFDRHGAAAVRAGYAERARLNVKATFGWRGLAAAFASTGRVRLRSSRASQVDLRAIGVRA